MSLKVKSNGINFNVPTIEDLPTERLEEDLVCVVTDENRGGVFVYREANALVNNGGTIFNGWTRQYDGAVNANWFGATTAAYQYVVSSFNDVIFNGEITLTSSLCITRPLQKITCLGSFTATNFPTFIVGQNSNGTLPTEPVVGIEIEDLTISGGTIIPDSCGILLRKATTVKITNPHIWGVDTAIKTDGLVGSYENSCSVITNPDFRYCNYGIYDPNGALQACKIIGGRIEANNYSGASLNSINVSFIGVTIEGNQVTNNTGEVYFGSLTRKVNFTNCYFEVGAGKNIFYNDSAVLSLTLQGTSLYGGDITNYLIGNTLTLTEGSIEINNCFFNNNFAGIYNASITGNVLVSIGNNFKGFSASYTTGMTFSGSASYNVLDRSSGISTGGNLNVLARANLNSGYRLGRNTVSTSAPLYIGAGVGSLTTNWTNLALVGAFQGAVPTVYRVVLIGRADPTNTRMSEFRVIVKQDLATIEVATKITDWNMGGVVPSFQISGGYLQANQLSSFTSWVCHIEAMSYGYSL